MAILLNNRWFDITSNIRKAKDIRKAQIETVLALANVLKCEAWDLLG